MRYKTEKESHPSGSLRYAAIVTLLLFIATVGLGTHSYRNTQLAVNTDMSQALQQALREYRVINTDTIQAFNKHLQIPALKGKATLAVDIRRNELQCRAECPSLTILALSDQRPTVLMTLLTMMWLFYCRWYRRRTMKPEGLCLGRMTLAPDGETFLTAGGDDIHLTPMQRQLMIMFFRTPGHRLSKADICNALWPGKPDASDTLYTLMRRLRPVIEQHSDLRIETDRGRFYRLTIK